MVYSTRRFVSCLACVILFLCFSVLLGLRLPRLGKRELVLVLFVRLFDLRLFGFVCFLFLLVSGKGCGLWLWHSLDFSLTPFFSILLRFSFVCASIVSYVAFGLQLFLISAGFGVSCRLCDCGISWISSLLFKCCSCEWLAAAEGHRALQTQA